MKRGGPAHPKTTALASALGLERWQAVGVLESLWHFTAQYARRGDVGRFSDEAIAQGMDWRGEASRLVVALTEAGWLDACDCHRLRIHDWPDHADQGVKASREVRGGSWLRCYSAPPEPDLSATSVPPEPDLSLGSVPPEQATATATEQGNGTGQRQRRGPSQPEWAPVRATGPPNPLVSDRRPDLERELLEHVTAIAARDDLDPTEVMGKLSEWQGRSVMNPASMSDDRLAQTLQAARKRRGPLKAKPPPEPTPDELHPFRLAVRRMHTGLDEAAVEREARKWWLNAYEGGRL